jgi:hypothetical protein
LKTNNIIKKSSKTLSKYSKDLKQALLNTTIDTLTTYELIDIHKINHVHFNTILTNFITFINIITIFLMNNIFIHFIIMNRKSNSNIKVY